MSFQAQTPGHPSMPVSLNNPGKVDSKKMHPMKRPMYAQIDLHDKQKRQPQMSQPQLQTPERISEKGYSSQKSHMQLETPSRNEEYRISFGKPENERSQEESMNNENRPLSTKTVPYDEIPVGGASKKNAVPTETTHQQDPVIKDDQKPPFPNTSDKTIKEIYEENTCDVPKERVQEENFEVKPTPTTKFEVEDIPIQTKTLTFEELLAQNLK